MMRRGRPGRRRPRGEAGQSTLELVAVVPVVLVLTGILLQLAAAVWAVTDVTDAARQGARASSKGDNGCAAATRALSGSLGDDVVSCSSGGGTLRIEVAAPILVPGFDDFTIVRTASMPDVADL
jgi:Flp pilus assembly protein TadG